MKLSINRFYFGVVLFGDLIIPKIYIYGLFICRIYVNYSVCNRGGYNIMGIEVYLTQARSGDCIIVRCGNKDKKVNILIDSGQGAEVFEKALKRIEKKHEKVDMIIWTHDDNDHIKGACNLLKRLKFADKEMKNSFCERTLKNITEERILFNFGGNGTEALLKAEDVKKLASEMGGKLDFHKLGFVLADEKEKEDITYPNMIQLQWEYKEGIMQSKVIKTPTKEDLNTEKEHLEIVILSPTRENLVQYINTAWKKINFKEKVLKSSGEKKEREWNKSIQYWMEHFIKLGNDESIANKASIAFLLIYEGVYTLFAGDALPSEMVTAGKEFLRRSGDTKEYLEVAFIKLAHHGSSRNINHEFLHFFRTKSYLISTGGNSKYQHPGKGTFAVIAETLSEGESADIYGNYNWWNENQEFRKVEDREGNWNREEGTCELIDKEGKRKQLRFHKLELEPVSISSNIQLGR